MRGRTEEEADDQGAEGSDAGVLKNNGNIRVLKEGRGAALRQRLCECLR